MFRQTVTGSVNGVVPEPSNLAFVGVGLGLMAFLRKLLVAR